MARVFPVKVLVNKDELADLKWRAGREPLSSFCRSLLFPGKYTTFEPDAALASQVKADSDANEDLMPKKKDPKHPNKYCREHHVMGCLVCE